MSKPAKKTCRACGEAKPVLHFPAQHPLCKPCHGARRRDVLRGSVRRPRGQRRCAQCGEEMPLSMFHWLKSSGTHHSYCRPCHAAYMAERYRRLRRAGRGR